MKNTFKTVLAAAAVVTLLSGTAQAMQNVNQFSSSYRQEATLSTSETQQLQQALANQGFYSGRIDGQWGMRTTAAITDYQRAHNLAPTGSLDINQLNALGVQVSDASAKTLNGVQPASGNPNNPVNINLENNEH